MSQDDERCVTCGRKLRKALTEKEKIRREKFAEIGRQNKGRSLPKPKGEEVRAYVEALAPGQTVTSDHVAITVDASIHTVRNVLTAMFREGLIDREGSARWGIQWRRLAKGETPKHTVRVRGEVGTKEVRQIILSAVPGWRVTNAEFVEKTGASLHVVRTVFTGMRKEGFLVKAGAKDRKSYYQRTDKPA